MDEAYFWRDGAQLHPNPISAGPWREDSLMGRVVAGLIGHEIGRRHLERGFVPARLTVELYRLPGFAPIAIDTRVIRDGGRIRLIEADFVSGGESMARATCQLLRQTEEPAGTIWSPPSWDAPPPDALPYPDPPLRWKWHLVPIVGAIGENGPKRAWMMDYRELVAGEPLTPFGRIALAADFVSPFSHIGDAGATYINTDVTLYLHRLPERDWIGFDVTDHQASAGIAVGQCRLYDQLGAIGSASCAALAQRRPTLDGPMPTAPGRPA